MTYNLFFKSKLYNNNYLFLSIKYVISQDYNTWYVNSGLCVAWFKIFFLPEILPGNFNYLLLTPTLLEYYQSKGITTSFRILLPVKDIATSFRLLLPVLDYCYQFQNIATSSIILLPKLQLHVLEQDSKNHKPLIF